MSLEMIHYKYMEWGQSIILECIYLRKTYPPTHLSFVIVCIFEIFECYSFITNILFIFQVNVISHCLPGLLKEVSSFNLQKATRAQEAVAALQKLHAIKKRGPKANSLFLDQILSSSGLYSGECFVGDRLHWNNFVRPYTDEKLKANIKLSSVNINYDANVWDWDLVTAIFKSPVSDAFKVCFIIISDNYESMLINLFAKFSIANLLSKEDVILINI